MLVKVTHDLDLVFGGGVIGVVRVHEDKMMFSRLELYVIYGRSFQQLLHIGREDELNASGCYLQICVAGFIETDSVLKSTLSILTHGNAQGHLF